MILFGGDFSICRIFRSGWWIFCALTASAQVNITSANYDNYRSNSNPHETVLTQSAVGGPNFGKLGGFAVDGQIYAQPLYVGGLFIPRTGTKNVVYVATMNNSVYAIDADAPTSTVPLWQANLGTPVPASALTDALDITPQVGILSTPAIDTAGRAIYVVSETFESGLPVFRLHALSLITGREMFNGPTVITAFVAGSGAASVNGTINFDPLWQLQRPGLALANGLIYIAFGSHGDAGPYHGWVLAYNASNIQQQAAAFNVTPNGSGGGIWQSGHAPAIDDSGNIYIISGNGDFDNHTNLGGSVIKLSPKLSVLDWYTPAQWQSLNANDLDVGSTGAILLPGSNLLLAGDKGGYLIDLSTLALGHLESGPGVSDFQASPAGIFEFALLHGPQGAMLYEHDWNGVMKGFAVSGSALKQTPALQGTWTGDSLYNGLAISSNAGAGGIVWETTGDHSQAGVPGTLHAWNASDLTGELWNSDLHAGDVLGSFAKFVSPLVANGRVYVPTTSNELVIYGLQPTGATGSTGPQISAVVNGASFIQNVVCPGEVLAILGANLGPQNLVGLQVDQAGDVSNDLSGTQVFFDGNAAPLLYTASDQVGTVVPFGVAGPVTQVLVRYGGQPSSAALLPVGSTCPALFTESGLGSGQAAALNQDSSVNSVNNPAAAGSFISLFATGLGQTTPAELDGVTNGIDPAPANLKISVTISGLPATVVYAGAAPGLIGGIYQINAQIPPKAATGFNIIVTVQVGNNSSPGNTWVAIQ